MRLPATNFIVEDSDGNPLLLVFKGTPSATGVRHGLSVEQNRRITEVLTKIHFHAPRLLPRIRKGGKNVRISGNAENYVFDGGIWLEQGIELRVPVPTLDCRAGFHAWFPIVHEFKETGTWRVLGEIKDWLEGTEWRRCLGSLPPYSHQYLGGNPATDPTAMPGHTLTINFNNLSKVHYDVKNHKWGLMTVHGDFSGGGGLFLPDLEMYLPLAPGDIVACLFQKIRHYVEKDFTGTTRYTGVHILWDEVYRAWTSNAALWSELSAPGLVDSLLPRREESEEVELMHATSFQPIQGSSTQPTQESSSSRGRGKGRGRGGRSGPIRSTGTGSTSAGRF